MVIVVAVLWLVVMRNLVTSRHGTAFRVLRQCPVLASSLGISVYRMKLTAYALGALPAGLAGCLFANLDLYLSRPLRVPLAITILAASILGGSMQRLRGRDRRRHPAARPESRPRSTVRLVIYGGFLIVGGVLLGGGIAGLVAERSAGSIAGPSMPAGAARRRRRRPAGHPRPSLRSTGLGKSLRRGAGPRRRHPDGARRARSPPSSGPNGSGKTTLLNVICGYYRLDEGTIVIGGEERPRKEQPHRVARAGVARTFQTANIPEGSRSPRRSAPGGTRPTGRRCSRPSSACRPPTGSAPRRPRPPTVMPRSASGTWPTRRRRLLPLGTRRLLEVARCLIRAPGVLLLDEAASGLDEDEVEHLAVSSARSATPAARSSWSSTTSGSSSPSPTRSTCSPKGQVIASGTPAEIESHPRVLEEYLGVEAAVAAELLDEAAAPRTAPGEAEP